jgi:hypothetical protein
MNSAKREPGSVHELASLYVLGALDDSEKKIFEKHLEQGCSACEVDLRKFIFVADAIGRSASVDAPARVRERLRSEISLSA